MKIVSKLYLGLTLALMALNKAVAQEPSGGGGSEVPEMDAGIAVLGLCLAAGIVTLISEHRRK